MLIVAGSLYVNPPERDDYVTGCRGVVEQARNAPGCLDFTITADPIEPGRVNVYERWETDAELERFRGLGARSRSGRAHSGRAGGAVPHLLGRGRLNGNITAANPGRFGPEISGRIRRHPEIGLPPTP